MGTIGNHHISALSTALTCIDSLLTWATLSEAEQAELITAFNAIDRFRYMACGKVQQ